MAGEPSSILDRLARLEAKLDIFSVFKSGMIFFMPFPPDELGDFLYHANGDYTSVTSEPGKMLMALPQSYKTFWNIAVNTSNNTIPLPDLYTPDRRGYFPRAGDIPGTFQEDAMREIEGTYSGFHSWKKTNPAPTGAFGKTLAVANSALSGAGDANHQLEFIDFKSGRCVNVANENRPSSVWLTPAVLLI
ncbi:MAG: hypothetical protein LBL95_02885 [Deltaproteobacteria bacterium]|jgi:hypothetical protein|nr:hypothetical protein [Deltaproteobacteria bacterium]